METVWQKNLRDAILLDPLILIHGNVKDLFVVSSAKQDRLPATLKAQPYHSFDIWLALEFEELGFPCVLLYDPVDGAVALRGHMASRFREMAAPHTHGASQGTAAMPAGERSGRETGPSTASLPALPGASELKFNPDDWMVPLESRQKPEDFFRTLYANVFPRIDSSIAVICRFTDRYLSYTDRQDAAEKERSLLIQKAAMIIPPPTGAQAPQGRLALLFDLEGSIPQELSVHSPFARSIRIPDPSIEEREAFFRENHQRFFSKPDDRLDATNEEQLREVANLADGLKTQDLISLIQLSHQEQKGLSKAASKGLLDRFKFGPRTNAWERMSPTVLLRAKEQLRSDVKGQDEVIDEIVPTLIRAKLGMSDMGSSKYANKPRGVFFFVGPTGVGKTELSKSIARLLFNDESALIRFDMSEYSEEHQQARLIGAPPGYVGFDQGGQLTNAIVEKPFSVVLFDEIEKAHPRILDKFLQILDDGRLTDGMGRTVYFSEAILIFTSNIGTAPTNSPTPQRESDGRAITTDDDAAVPPTLTSDAYRQLSEMTYEDLSLHFRTAVHHYFVNRLGRPEILNRIGEHNILVFNILKDENVKNEIIQKHVSELAQHLKQKYRIQLHLAPSFLRILREHPSGFDRNGARGVRNLLSKFVMNPLAEALFDDQQPSDGRTWVVDWGYRDGDEMRNFENTRLDAHWGKN